jgi:NAD(P)-dependent dehydrogenase (short-subunit alcohol dehydrogenase family)
LWWAIPARTQIKFRSDAAKCEGDVDDMVAFITGGGSGIGQAAAKLLARRGARVWLAGRTQDQLAEVAQAIGGAGGSTITVPCDVSDEDSVRSAIATTVETWGRLDVVVANAGVNGTWAGIEKLAVEEFRSTLDINLIGTHSDFLQRHLVNCRSSSRTSDRTC